MPLGQDDQRIGTLQHRRLAVGKAGTGDKAFIAGADQRPLLEPIALALIDQMPTNNKSVQSGSFKDLATGPDSGTIVIEVAGLAADEYKLTLNGQWSVPGVSDKWHVYEKGAVSLSEKGTFSATNPISPVPEPESYAMFLAGLGLVGTIALRRRKTDAS